MDTLERSVRILNIPSIDDLDKSRVMDSINETYDKLSRMLHHTPELTVQFKDYRTTHGKHEHEVHSRLIIPGVKILSTAKSWNLLTALQEAMDELEREVRKKFKNRRSKT